MEERVGILSVSALNEYVSTLLAADPILHTLRVTGEISGFKRHTSGHLYFSLKDENALVRCVMFRQYAQRLSFQPKDGMTVVLSGYASLYARDGAFQLYALSLNQRGEGELYARFMELKGRLEQEGWFDESHKKPVPFLPRRVGVVTSGTGAAVQDVLQIIRRRFPAMSVVVAPVKVQGEGAAEEIAGAIFEMNRLHAADVLIVGRGGGSIEDLWAFNEMPVIRAIYESDIPVISAVGHETDFTIADFVADLRAPTPSAAAELAVPEQQACRDAIADDCARLGRALTASLRQLRSRVTLLGHSRGFHALSGRLANERQTLDYLSERMNRAVQTRIAAARAPLSVLSGRVTALSPLSVLERGYALVQDASGATLSDVGTLRAGDAVSLVLRDGRARATVDEVIRNEGAKE